MTCEGCEREVTLLDGHYCGRCSSEISGAVTDALADVDAISGPVHDVAVGKDGFLHIRVGRDGGAADA